MDSIACAVASVDDDTVSIRSSQQSTSPILVHSLYFLDFQKKGLILSMHMIEDNRAFVVDRLRIISSFLSWLVEKM